MGRPAWVPWGGAIATATMVEAVGYPSWLATIFAALVFVFADERRHRGVLPSAPLIHDRREAWLFVVSEALVVVWAVGSIVALSGETLAWSLLWLVLTVGGLFAVQFLNVVRHREHGDSLDQRSLNGARHEAWSLIRVNGAT